MFCSPPHSSLRSVLAALLSTVFSVTFVQAKTTVSGTISENVTWNPAGSPYEVATTTVAANVTVTVEPGTVVQLLDFATLDVHGRIVAAGSAAQKIFFTSLSGPLEGNPWRAIRLTNGDGAGNNLGASQFAHCTFEGGGNWYNCMLEVGNGAGVTIDHCVFQHSRTDGIHFLENSGGPISNTGFENNAGYALWLRGSSPDVTTCHFSGNGNAGRLESGAGKGSFPVFVNTTFEGDDRMHIADHMATGGTLTAAPYFIDGHRVATANETITIEGGASFHLADYASWTINGNLLALGTEDAPILFTSASGATQGNPWRAVRLTNGDGTGNGLPSSGLSYCTFEGGGDWYSCMLDVLAGSEISMDQCVFRHSRTDGIHFLANSTGSISDTRFENNAGYAILLQGSSPEVTGSHFSGNGNVGRLESYAGKGSFPAFVNTTFEGDGRVHIAGSIDSGGMLTAAPYFIDSHRVATANETITIEGGASFHMADYATWTIHGNLLALGTEAAPILFTSASGATEGNPWRAVRLTNRDGAGNGLPSSRLSYCTFEGGGDWYSCMLEATGGAPVSLDHCTVRHSAVDGVRFLGGAGGAISACTFQNIAQYGLRLEGTSPAITASTFESCGAQAILLLGNPTTGSSYPVFSQNTFDPDNYIEIGSHFHTDGHLSNPGQAYLVTGRRDVLPGVRTSIAPGTTLEFANFTGMLIQGALHAEGTQMDPVTFTSDDEVKDRGQWRALVFTPERTQSSILQHCQIEAGGEWNGSSVEISGTQPVTIEQCFLRQGLGDGIRIVNDAPASIHLSSISGFAGHGISVSNATADIHGCDIYGNDVSGVYTTNATGQVVDSLLRDNKRYGIWASGNRVPSVSNCYISGNAERGIHNQASVDLFAINNWWGDPTGPHHPSLNPEGKGDTISDRVVFQPYRVFASNVPQELAATLENGVPVAGTFAQGVSGYYYAVDVPAGQSLTLTVDDEDNAGTTHVYLRRNSYPTPSNYQARHETNAADQRVFVSGAGPGRWYAFVFQFTSGPSSPFTIRADMADIAIQRISPERHANTVPITMTIEGAGFFPGTSIDLISQANSVAASQVDVESFTQINVVFDAFAVPAGVYDVRVSAPGKEPAVLPMAFTAVDGGQGKLVTRLIVPGAVGYHQVATVYVEYANDGDATMAAPILLLDAEQNGSHGALLTLDRRYVTRGFWTSAIPEGFHNTIQFLASGAQAGVLHPGESMRVPVYYAGWLKPWDFSYPPIQFSLGQLAPDDSAPIDWNSLRQGVQPDGMPDDLFNALLENVQTTIGNTWGQYVAAIADNAAYLESIGQRTDDVTELLAFELQQADFVDTTIPLSGGIDMLVEAPGWPLIFSRQFFHGVSGRYRSGLLGRGWVTPWETSLSERPDGTVLLESGPRRRIFQPDVRGGYLSSPGDPSKLVKQAGGFLLEESSGETSMFHTDGRLAYIENRNGVRIECEYTGNQLTALTHTEGMRLTMAYLPNGRLATLSSANLGSVTFAYDNTGQYLLSVTYPEGNQSLYTYETASTSLPKRHALLSASMAGKRHFFAYDARGRLGSYHKGDPQLAYTYMYSDTGNIDITDPAGNVTRMAMTGNGQVGRIRDGEGHTTTFGYDAIHQGITRVSLRPPGNASNSSTAKMAILKLSGLKMARPPRLKAMKREQSWPSRMLWETERNIPKMPRAM